MTGTQVAHSASNQVVEHTHLSGTSVEKLIHNG